MQLDNYIFYKGAASVGSDTYQMAKLQNCKTCLMRANKLEKVVFEIGENKKIPDFLKKIREHHEYVGIPFITLNGGYLLNPGDSERYPIRINKTFSEMIEEKLFNKNEWITVFVTDKSLKNELRVEFKIGDPEPIE